MFDIYTHHETILELKEKYYTKSKLSRSVEETEDQCNQLTKYPRGKRSDEEIED